jgi:hypothetical protein
LSRWWTAAIATLIELRCRGKNGSTALNPNWIPNAIFMGDLVRHAAARRGVPVKG